MTVTEVPKIQATYLAVKWTTSRGAETYGYNICTVTDEATDKRYRCMGGGYDMLGTSFGEWLEDVYQLALQQLSEHAYMVWSSPVEGGPWSYVKNENGCYGMNRQPDGSIRLDGGCGESSMQRIAAAIGLRLTRTYDRKGHTTGYIVDAHDAS